MNWGRAVKGALGDVWHIEHAHTPGMASCNSAVYLWKESLGKEPDGYRCQRCINLAKGLAAIPPDETRADVEDEIAYFAANSEAFAAAHAWVNEDVRGQQTIEAKRVAAALGDHQHDAEHDLRFILTAWTEREYPSLEEQKISAAWADQTLVGLAYKALEACGYGKQSAELRRLKAGLRVIALGLNDSGKTLYSDEMRVIARRTLEGEDFSTYSLPSDDVGGAQ